MLESTATAKIWPPVHLPRAKQTHLAMCAGAPAASQTLGCEAYSALAPSGLATSRHYLLLASWDMILPCKGAPAGEWPLGHVIARV